MHAGPARDFPGLLAVRISGVLWFVFVGISPVFADIDVYAQSVNISVLIGHDALFSVNYTNSTIPRVRWEFQPIKGKPFEITSFNVSDTTNIEVLQSYKHRLSVYSNGSMTLRNVSEADNGTYTAIFVTYGPDGNENVDVKLQIFDTLTSFFIEMDSTLSGSTVTLTCKTNSSLVSYVSYYWSSLCIEDRVCGSSNLRSISVNVTRRFFICTASNPLNTKHSDAFLLESNCTEMVNEKSKQVVTVLQGNSAKFHLKGNISTGEMFAVEWTFQKSQCQVAVAMINDSDWVADGYKGRAKINKNNGSMTLLEAQQSNAGNYSAYVSSCDKRWQEVIELQVNASTSYTKALIGGLVGGVIVLLLLLLVLIGCIYYHRQKKGENELTNSNLESSSEIHDFGVVKTEHEGSVKIRTLTFV
uniref:Immunoglobulin domain-containing protein n=1 Tax=Eptatretus burgeri TaxID=7764 RepID=A0A8C4R7I8_EPTBU